MVYALINDLHIGKQSHRKKYFEDERVFYGMNFAVWCIENEYCGWRTMFEKSISMILGKFKECYARKLSWLCFSSFIYVSYCGKNSSHETYPLKFFSAQCSAVKYSHSVT